MNANYFVQTQLMNFLCNQQYERIDTSKILFVLDGAFSDLERMEKEKEKVIGFRQDDAGESHKITLKDNSLRSKPNTIGAERELIGRIKYIVQLKALTETELAKVLLHPQHGIIAKKVKEFAQLGITLHVDNGVIKSLLNKATEENLGARSLENVLNEILQAHTFDALTHGYDMIRLHEGVLYGDAPAFSKAAK